MLCYQILNSGDGARQWAEKVTVYLIPLYEQSFSYPYEPVAVRLSAVRGRKIRKSRT